MTYDIFYQGLYFGTVKDMPENQEQALQNIVEKLNNTGLYSMPVDYFHIEQEI